jgi:hypothetical protein
MTFAIDAVGKDTEPFSFSYTWKDAALYALGVGAKASELDYLYEGRGPRVLPSFAVIPAFEPVMRAIERINGPMDKVVHGTQRVKIHRPFAPKATLLTTAVVARALRPQAHDADHGEDRHARRRDRRARLRDLVGNLVLGRRRRLERRARAGREAEPPVAARGLHGRRADVARASAALPPLGGCQSAPRGPRVSAGGALRKQAHPARPRDVRVHDPRDRAGPEIVFLGAKRTAFGTFNGALKDLTATDLGVHAAKAAIAQSGVAVDQFGHVFFGNVLQTSKDAIYLARHVGLRNGLPASVPALTLNRLCGSGFEAVSQAARELLLGDSQVCLVGGTESMSQAPTWSAARATA